MIYRLALKIRNSRYEGGKRSVKAGIPTICVGNITVGGTGKTPHTELILRTLLGSGKWGTKQLAVLSRGYKRKSKGFHTVDPSTYAVFCGDEPMQLCKKFPSVTIAVDKDREEGCRTLQLEHGAELVVLDDAFQYRKLHYDLNILLVNYNRPVTKDSLLPFGRLRDLPERLYEAEIVIVSKCPSDLNFTEKSACARELGYASYDPTSCIAVTKGGKEQILLFTSICYGQPMPMFPESDPRYVYSHKLILFTGIADDKPLFDQLSDSYKIVRHMVFPDHHGYSKADLRRIASAVDSTPTAMLATTEKDAQRLLEKGKISQKVKERMFYIPITVQFLTDEEKELFTKTITQL